MDKALFIGSTSANTSMHQLEVITNNLANADTTGFRADFELMKQYHVNNQADKARSYSVLDRTYSDFKPGPVIHTGRDLDVAVNGSGFIAVQNKAGQEAYTRAGDLQIRNGFLTTRAGELVLGTSGFIEVGTAQRVALSSDGTVAVKVQGVTDMVTVNRIKLVKPNEADVHKGPDGLFYVADGAVKQDPKLKLTTGSIEGSNVNPVETLTSLIQLSRNFEFHTKFMHTLQEEAGAANQLLQIGR